MNTLPWGKKTILAVIRKLNEADRLAELEKESATTDERHSEDEEVGS